MYLTLDELQKFLSKKNIQKHIDTIAKKHKKKRIVLYGAGLLAEYIVDTYNLSNLNIVGISDSKFAHEKIDFNNIKSISPEEIINLSPDLILITAFDAKLIKKFLKVYFPELDNIPSEHIIPQNFLDKIKIFCMNR